MCVYMFFFSFFFWRKWLVEEITACDNKIGVFSSFLFSRISFSSQSGRGLRALILWLLTVVWFHCLLFPKYHCCRFYHHHICNHFQACPLKYPVDEKTLAVLSVQLLGPVAKKVRPLLSYREVKLLYVPRQDIRQAEHLVSKPTFFLSRPLFWLLNSFRCLAWKKELDFCRSRSIYHFCSLNHYFDCSRTFLLAFLGRF